MVLSMFVVHTWCIIVILLSSCDQIASIRQPFGGSLIDQALNNVFGRANLNKVNTKSNSNKVRSSLKRRCFDKLACEYQVPVVELNNVVFHGGNVILSQITDETKKAITDLQLLFAQKPGHLPSILSQSENDQSDWMAGPKINVTKASFESLCPPGSMMDTSAYFLSPWERHNAFHSLNDNVFAVLSSIVMQYITASPDDTNTVHPTHRTLYTFKSTHRSQTYIYQMLNVIFNSDVQPAASVLKGGPYCFRHVTWGAALKVFYRDSLMDLRRVTFDVFKEIMHLYVQRRDSANNSTTAVVRPKKTQPKVVINTRRDTKPADSPARKLATLSEGNIIKAFNERLGVETSSVCCNFAVVNSIDKYIDQFLDVDICIGLHGAGMSNCIFGAPGMVMIEFQMQHAYGFDSFMKIAHMSQGQYLFYDIREAAKKMSGSGPGSIVEKVTIDSMVDVSLKLWNYSQSALTAPLPTDGFSEFSALQSRRNLLNGVKKPPPPKANKGYVWQSKAIDLFNSRKQYAYKAQYKEEIIVDYTTMKIYYHQSATELANKLNKKVRLIFGKDLSKFTIEDMSIIQVNGVDRTLTVDSVFVQKSDKNSGINVAGSNLVLLSGPQVFWLMLNPYPSHTYTVNSILGPKLDDNFNHCVGLPYYKFRTMTTTFKEHRGECDKRVIFTKRSGGNDAKLTQ